MATVSDKTLAILGVGFAAWVLLSPRRIPGMASPGLGSPQGAGADPTVLLFPLMPRPFPAGVDPSSQNPYSPDWVPEGAGYFPPTDDPFSPNPGGQIAPADITSGPAFRGG